MSAAAAQLTLAGRPCQFPFFYRGEAHSQCVPYSSSDSSAFCLDVDGHFSMCSAAITGGYAQPVSWLDQWAGQGQLQTQVLTPVSIKWMGPKGLQLSVPQFQLRKSP